MAEKILEGKRTIVTGASSGIGAATAEIFAREGASIWVVGGSSVDGMKKTVAACTGMGVKADGNCYDLTQASRGADLVRDGAEFLGGLDILVNCAAMRCHKPLTDFEDEDIENLFDVNAKSVFYSTREAAKIMVPQESGRILMIGSIDGQRGVPGNSLYCATKTSMHNLTRAAAAELGPKGIRVNCLLPGTTESPRVKKIHEERPDYAAWKLPKIPIRRFAAPEEMAKVALFMVSDDNDFMNGTLVTSDGGVLAS